MKFHLAFDIKQMHQLIHHRHKIMLIGSCFTENIGEKLKKHKFQVLENPNGILFNPVSVAKTIATIIQNKKYTADDLFCLNETWHSWQHHSRFSGITITEALTKINTSTESAYSFLQTANYLLVTLGSAWVYTLTEHAANANKGIVVANNHKAPANWFEKQLMSAEQVKQGLKQVVDDLLKFNPSIEIIFTISPVRHLREGVINNNRSKAILIQAVHNLIDEYKQLYYFPAYELVIDDLRDYRFYSEDLVHPNYAATEYVWEKFVEACMTEDTKVLMKQIAEINVAFQHKAFNVATKQHQKFLQSYFQKTTSLQANYPYLNFEQELKYFNQLG